MRETLHQQLTKTKYCHKIHKLYYQDERVFQENRTKEETEQKKDKKTIDETNCINEKWKHGENF